jgi:serine/threonine-protein kinase
MDDDRNLLFGVLALQADLIDPARFVEACSAWATFKDRSLSEILVERGWLTPTDRADVERVLDRKLKKHGGDARAGLAEVSSDQFLQTLPVDTPLAVRQSLATTTLGQPNGPPAAAAARTPPAERYHLTRLHATGGIGRVWLARDEGLAREVALKEIRPERANHPTAEARFLREARITGQLEHPSIVPIYELGRRSAGMGLFYAMRFVRGRTLEEAAADYHARQSRGEAARPQLRELLTALVGVCNAVAFAHSRGVLHRDLKPQNVVLGDYGEVIVLDWGLARLTGQPDSADDAVSDADATDSADAETREGQVLGTPAYMAPEQAEGRLDRLGPATDVYGLGAILYEILTGQPPFTGSDTEPVLDRVIHSAPVRPRRVVPATPPALEAACLKALAKNPAGRYASAKDLAADLQHWLADEPVSAYRDPLTVRAVRWARRHRTLVTGVAAAGLVALAGLGVVLALQARSNSQLREANRSERQRFDLAMDAIRTFHTGVSEDVLLRQEGMKSLRNKLLGGAADFYRKLEENLASRGDRASRADLGRAYFELGSLTEMIGSKEEALAVHRRALALREALAAEPGADADARLDVATSLLAEGNVLFAAEKWAEARASYERARDLHAALTREDPADARFQRGLAKCHTSLGVLEKNLGKHREAQADFEAARAIYQGLIDAHPDSDPDRGDLARSFVNLSGARFQLGKLGEALATAGQARDAYQKLADAHPGVTGYRVGLAKTYEVIGSTRSQSGPANEALAAYERAQAVHEQLTRDYPAVAEFQVNLAWVTLNVSQTHARAGRATEALASCEKAREIFQRLSEANPSVSSYRFYLADSLCDLGDLLAEGGKWDQAVASYREALSITGKLADAHPDDPDYRYRQARALKRMGVVHQRAGRSAEAAADLRRGLQILESVSGKTSSEIERVYNLACYESLLAGAAASPGSGLTPAESRAAADKAMAHLRLAIDQGLSAADLLEGDTDLDPLRQREDFKKLLAGLKPSGK